MSGRFVRNVRDLRRPALLKQAMAAVDRGNLGAGFWLLDEAVGISPGDARTVLAFWDVAVACERAEAASNAMCGLIHRQALAGELEVASDHWIALVKEVPDASLDPASLVRIAPELRRRMEEAEDEETRADARAWLLTAIRHGVDPGTEALTPGLAVRLFEEARLLDPEAARRAANVALRSPDLDESKRTRVRQLLEELEPESRSGAAESSEPEVPSRRVHAPETPAASSPALRVLEATPIELGERGLLALEVASQRRMRIDYGAIEALAAALVEGLSTEAVLIIDLLFQRSRRGGTRRHVVRMRSDSFDPSELLAEGTASDDPLRSFLTELFERCRAVPLPDPDSALGLRPRHFPTLEAYERHVLEGLK